MDSKYNIGENRPVVPKFQIKTKPTPIVYKESSPKKMKLSDCEDRKPRTPPRSNFQEQRRSLPVFAVRNRLLEEIKRHATLIVMGETGSGKSTQIPQYVHSARIENNGKIAVTQPRRVAAISVAKRVADETGTELGGVVGYAVRFEDVTTKNTKIKYLTDGLLLREAIIDPALSAYNVVILDEAHERTVHTDVLFGIVKQAQSTRKQNNCASLKILIMSATMDVNHFSKYFNNCEVVYLEGRAHNVNVFQAVKQHEDYQFACLQTLFQIHRKAPSNHDVLMFLTGQEEIDAMAHRIRTICKDPEMNGPGIRVFVLYAAMPMQQQMEVFKKMPPNIRKVVLSTNIAETSLTISGIRYVIDSGMVKARTYHPTTGLDVLKVQRISQEQAWQRTGRAGRDAEGYCYRLYTKAEFQLMKETTVPEIQRSNLSTVAIQLLALGIHSLNFDFMDKPPRESILNAFEQLKQLGAIENLKDGKLTALGRKMAQFPLDPRFAKILLSSKTYGCLEEALTIIAVLSGESIFVSPLYKREQALEVRQKFVSPYGDHITVLNVFRAFNNVTQKKQWCHENFFNCRNLLYAKEVRNQLADICTRFELPFSSCGNNVDQIRKCMLAGLFMNTAELHRDKQYITLDTRQVVAIHPSSVLHGSQPHFVIFTEVVQTSKCYLRHMTVIESEWLQEVAPEYSRMHTVSVKSS